MQVPLTYQRIMLTAILLLLSLHQGCSDDTSSNGGNTSDTDSDSDANSNSDADSDSDSTSESECDWSAEFTAVFTKDHVVQIDIEFDEEGAWDELAKLKDTTLYKSATITIDGESMRKVGVRVKGNSSLQMSDVDNTKSLKIHFEEYVEGQRFHCVDRFSLNNSTKDPSMMREILSYELAEQFHIIAPRTAYAEVFVDGSLHGLFVMVQQVDHRFLKDHLGSETNGVDDGNLYKLYSDYDLSYLGEDAQPSDFGDDDAETGLVLKTNEDDPTMNDFSDVKVLTKAIDDALTDPTQEHLDALESIFDVEQYLRYQAWTLAISNLDAYYSMNHNLYLYHNPVSNQFIVIPWDTNEAYGAFNCRSGGPGDPGQSTDDVYTVDLMIPCGAEAPLNRLSYEIPEYRVMYCTILNEFVDISNIQSGGMYNISGEDERIEKLYELGDSSRVRMDSEGILTQPPGDYTYESYITAQGHDSGGGTGPQMEAIPNLGYFNETRLENLVQLIDRVCE